MEGKAREACRTPDAGRKTWTPGKKDRRLNEEWWEEGRRAAWGPAYLLHRQDWVKCLAPSRMLFPFLPLFPERLSSDIEERRLYRSLKCVP